ncbi:UNVERIFIED_CONTAM: hypothetical protein FKN15_066589 [Acipenser sinensis]
MDTAKEMWGMIVGNLALIQVQATVVGFLASIAAMMFGWIPEGHFKMGHAVLLCASSVTTAFVASLLLGLIMIGVIVGARKIGINPDNVATPIAASLGDLITLALLSSISWGLYKQMQSNDYMNMLVCAFFVALTPIWIIIARRTPSTREVLYSGWEPVIIAMAISSVGGLILDKTVSDPNFAGMAVFTPVINGVGGNLVAVQASRISTYLHMTGLPGAEPQANRPKCLNPCSAFFGSESNDYVNMLVCAFFVALTPIWIIIARRTPSTREVLYSGWEPVIIAMAISSVGGLILDKTVSDPNFAGMAVFTPVINGVGGNLVAVQASRISTYLHMTGLPGVEPQANRPKCLNPCSAFFGSGLNSRSARVLFLLVVPGHLVFLYTINSMQGGHTTLTSVFVAFYMTAALLQVLILLYMADWMVHWMWGRGMDPDNFSIPYLTALGDLLGTGFLALSFHILWLIGDRDSDVGD